MHFSSQCLKDTQEGSTVGKWRMLFQIQSTKDRDRETKGINRVSVISFFLICSVQKLTHLIQCTLNSLNRRKTAWSKTFLPSGRNYRCQDSLLVRTPDRDRNVASSNPGRSSKRIFFSRVNFCVLTLIRCPFHPHVTAVAHKDPGHSAKSAGGRLHLNQHTPLTQWSQSGLTMPLFRHSVGTYQETSSHVTHQGTLGHSCFSLLSHCGLILACEWN